MLVFDCSQEGALVELEDRGARLKHDVTTVGKALDLAYDKAVDGIPGVFGSEFAEGLAGRCNY